MPQRRFEGKVGLITAGAGGIGASTARLFAAEGAHVVIVDVDAEAGAELRQALTEQGLSAEYHNCDVTRSDDVTDLFDLLAASHGRLDFAANVVGGNGAEDTPDIELQDQTQGGWDATICAVATQHISVHEARGRVDAERRRRIHRERFVDGRPARNSVRYGRLLRGQGRSGPLDPLRRRHLRRTIDQSQRRCSRPHRDA